MSDERFMLPRPPLMPPEKARQVGLGYKALSEHFAEIGVQREAARAERESAWWLAYAISLAQTPPGKETEG